MTDAIDLADVTIHHSPDARHLTPTAVITRIEFSPTDFTVRHTKENGDGRWPDVTPPHWTGPLQYTLWVILSVDQVWHACGCIPFWRGRDSVGGPFAHGAADWWMRVPEMAGRQPAVGEFVGFFVTAGNAREVADLPTPRERSYIVAVPIPEHETAAYMFAPEAPSGDTSVPSPPTPPAPEPAMPPWSDVAKQVIDTVEANTAAVEELTATMASLRKNGLKVKK